MKITKVVIEGKEVEFKIPKRYTDKRKVEKEMHKLMHPDLYDNEEPDERLPLIKEKAELEIPIDIDKKTTIFVRESKLFSKEKWLRYFNNNVESITSYVEGYKNLLRKRNEAKNTI